MPSKSAHTISSILCASLLAIAPSAQAQKPFHIQNQWKIGGTGGWDYLVADPTAHRLYITHGPRVEVLDSTSGKILGAITGLTGTHGVALDDDGKFGYISDGGANAVVVFDRSSLRTVASIPAGTNPDGIVYEPVTKTVWAFNGKSHDVTVIDTATRKVTATVALPGKPEFPVADGTGVVFDNIEDKNEIVRLDARTPKITATWSACESPSGLAIDLTGRRLFAVCDGKKMAVIDANFGKLLATPAIGEGPDAASYDPDTKLAFASAGDGTLTVIDASGDSYKVLQSVATRKGARTVTIDPTTGKAYVVSAEFEPLPKKHKPHTRPTVKPDTFSIYVLGRD